MPLEVSELDEARQFLSRVIALPVDGEHAFIGIHYTWTPKNHKPKTKLPFTGDIAGDVPAAVARIRYIMNNKNNRDVYVCMGLQNNFAVTVNKRTGENQYRPDKNSSNILRLKSLFIDVDFKGGEHGYGTQVEAETALIKFYKDASIPVPNVVVHSGGGFHLYWCFSSDIPATDWQPLANALVTATKTHGLKCDTGVTSDRSRILRVPDTLNYKTDPPKPVRIFAWNEHDYNVEILKEALAPYFSVITSNVVNTSQIDLTAFLGVKPFAEITVAADIDDLGAGILDAPPIDLKTIFPECGFIKEALTTGGQTYDNHLWNMTTLLSVFTEQGIRAAHLMANKHPDYDKDTTDALFIRKEADRARGVGWPKCATISNAGATPCKTCKHFAKGGHPFNYSYTPARTPPQGTGSPVQAFAVTVEDNLPVNYARNAGGAIFRAEMDENGTIQHVTATTSHVANGHIDLTDGQILYFDNRPTPTSRTRRVALPVKFLYSQGADLTNVLVDSGVAFESKKEVAGLLMAWVDKLKSLRETHSDYPPYGWVYAENDDSENGIVGFAYGQRLFTPHGEFASSVGDAEMAKRYRPQGALEKWQRAVNMVTSTQRAGIDAIIASAFAGPLVAFTGEQGLFLNVYSSKSGAGKTTAMRTAQAVWGNPSTASQSLDDTRNSVQEKMGVLKSLPIFYDELKGAEAMKNMTALVFHTTQGKGKDRLTQNVQQRHSATWQTMLITACNNSLVDAFNDYAEDTDAAYYRLFELTVEQRLVGERDGGEVAEIMTAINSNFGMAGLVYAKYIGAHHMQIRALVQSTITQLKKQLEMLEAERFWLHAIVTLLIGAGIANRLGLTNINIGELKRVLFARVTGSREKIIEQPQVPTEEWAIALLMKFIADNNRHIMQTNIIWRNQGKPIGVVPLPSSPGGLNPDGISIQIGLEDKTMRIMQGTLHDWLKHNNIKKNVFISKMKETGGFEVTRGRLCAGISGRATAQMAMYELQWDTNPYMASFMESTLNPTSNVVSLVKP